MRNAAAAATSCVNDTDAAGVPNDYTDCDDTAVLETYGYNPSAGVTLAYAGTTATRLQIQASGPQGTTATYDSDTGRVVET